MRERNNVIYLVFIINSGVKECHPFLHERDMLEKE